MPLEINSEFTPNEAAALSELSVKQIHKELEYRVIEVEASPPRLRFPALVYLRALRRIDFQFSVADRSKVYRCIVDALAASTNTVRLAELMILELAPVVSEMKERIALFRKWKERLVEDSAIMGGAFVFPNSRLTVRHVGEMLERGESTDVILEDYPYLTDDDLRFSHIFVRAYPRVGRPRREPKAAD